MTTSSMTKDEIDLLNLGRSLSSLIKNKAFEDYLKVLELQIATREKVLSMPAQTTELWVAQETVKGALSALRLAHGLVQTIVTEAQEIASSYEVDFLSETPTETK